MLQGSLLWKFSPLKSLFHFRSSTAIFWVFGPLSEGFSLLLVFHTNNHLLKCKLCSFRKLSWHWWVASSPMNGTLQSQCSWRRIAAQFVHDKTKNQLKYISTSNLENILLFCLDILLEQWHKDICYSANLHLTENTLQFLKLLGCSCFSIKSWDGE